MKIDAIVFDLGGVLFDIDYQLTIEGFHKLGLSDASILYSQQSQVSLFDLLEKGQISEPEFYKQINQQSKRLLSDEEIRRAWNALLIGLTSEKMDLLRSLKPYYRLFLLSNTNTIHENAYRKMIIDTYGSFLFEELFEKMYLSHRIGMRKPDQEIFEFVLSDAELNPSTTLFIDDSIQHVNGAKKAGINSIWLPNGESLEELLLKNLPS